MPHRTKKVTLLTGFVLAIVLFATHLMAHPSASTRGGAATQPAGASVPGVNVSLLNLSTNQTWSVKTNRDRDYAPNQVLLLTTLPQVQQSSKSIYSVEMAGQSGNRTIQLGLRFDF
jgi:hypothetical protein